MDLKIEKLKKEFTSLMMLKDEVDKNSGLYRSIMIEMGMIKLQILKLSGERYGAYNKT